MKAILIDPYKREISEVEVTEGTTRDHLDSMHKLIGCDSITAVTVSQDPDETLYLDDEGLYVEDQAYFKIAQHYQPLAGRGLVLGTGYDGESIATTTEVAYWQANVAWLEVEFSHMTQTEGTTTLFGKPALSLEQRAHFRPKDPNSKP